jgi:sulfite reductase (NADPH) hemoprotein beta-component
LPKRDLGKLLRLAHQRLATATRKLADIIIVWWRLLLLANAKSIPIAEAMQQRFDNLDYQHDLATQLNISGVNAQPIPRGSHRHSRRRQKEEWYQISIGGSSGRGASIAEIIGPSFSRAAVPNVIDEILGVYLENRLDGERFLDCSRRIGMEPFRERVYAHAH